MSRDRLWENSTAISSFLKVEVSIFGERMMEVVPDLPDNRFNRTVNLADNGIHCRLREFDHLTNGPLLSVTALRFSSCSFSFASFLLSLCTKRSVHTGQFRKEKRSSRVQSYYYSDWKGTHGSITICHVNFGYILSIPKITILFLSSLFFCFLFKQWKTHAVHIIFLQIEIKTVLHCKWQTEREIKIKKIDFAGIKIL